MKPLHGKGAKTCDVRPLFFLGGRGKKESFHKGISSSEFE